MMVSAARWTGRSLPACLLIVVLPAQAQQQLWVRQPGTSSFDYAYAVASDGSGGTFVAGHTYGSWAGPKGTSSDVWMARFDGAGTRLWVRQYATTVGYRVRSACADGSGGVYLCGDTLSTAQGTQFAWFGRYDQLGNPTWYRELKSNTWDSAMGVVADAAGGIYVTGWTKGALAGPNKGGPYSSDAWVARYDGAGNQRWIRQFGTYGWEYAWAAAPDGSGGVYLCGEAQGPLGTPIYSTGAWLARYDDAGERLWLLPFGTIMPDSARALAADGSGGVYVAGSSFNVFSGLKLYDWEAWLGRFDGSGNQQWMQRFGTMRLDAVNSAAPDGAGGVYLSGFTAGSLGGPAVGYGDAWLARYDGSANLVWLDQLGTTTNDSAQAIAPDGAGGLFVAGFTAGMLGGTLVGKDDAWLARYQ